MAKVSIGLRGWRFDEAEVFDEDGEFRPFEDLPPDTQRRLVRLAAVHDEPCQACWLLHGDESVEDCAVASAVYGEPFEEVLLCDAHERDFHFWYEREGHRFAGTEEFQDRFHEWFAAGGRASDGYEGVEHVETEPADLPDPTVDPSAANAPVPEAEQVEIDLRNMEAYEGAAVTERREKRAENEDLDDDDLDLDTEYPG
jgi:hypothetical protein